MVKTYDELRDENGIIYQGRTRLFIRQSEVDSGGNFGEFEQGSASVFEASGYQFIVDDYVISQIDKLKVVDGNLVVRDGEVIQERIKTPTELKIEAMEREIQALRADADRQADASLLDYTDKPTE